MSDTKEANSKSSDIEKYVTGEKGDENSNSGGVGGLTTTTMSAVQTVQTNALVIATTTNNVPPPAALLTPAPNSKPRERDAAPIETYVYRDFASAEPSTINTGTSHERMPPQSLQSQKLPSKLAAMLSDPDLASVLTWMPHGRSWKILNRELFSSFALPRYFGHSNHASFVRIVNAWGFRRISIGVDRDSYYHELFLRGKPSLHQRMKRLPSCHRKTPVDKDDKSPDFYDLAKASPLPEIAWSSNSTNQIPGNFAGTAAVTAVGTGGGAFPPGGLSHASMMGGGLYMPETVKPIHYGDATGAFSSSAMNGLMGGGIGGGVGMGVGGLAANSSSSYGMAENPMLSLLGMNNDHLSGNGSLAQQPPTDASSLNAYTQSLQRENENLMLKIKLLEYENQAKQLQQQQQQQHQWSMGNTNQQHSINLTEDNAATGGGAALGANNAINNMGSMGGATSSAAAPSYNPNETRII